MFNVVDAAGNLWEWLDDHYDLGLGNDAGWSTAIVDVGKDAAFARGQAYTYVYGASDASSWRSFIGGGQFDNGVYCGSRCLNSNANPWNANGNVGLRCVCDHQYQRGQRRSRCHLRSLTGGQPIHPGPAPAGRTR
jgi:formylglycine-generating enzyme required for sulfatase activity